MPSGYAVPMLACFPFGVRAGVSKLINLIILWNLKNANLGAIYQYYEYYIKGR
jgi:hypothetical protein